MICVDVFCSINVTFYLYPQYVSYLSCLFIAVSVITFCVTTIPGVRDRDRLIGTDKNHSVVREIELVCTIFFTIEFVARVLLCPSKTYFIKQPMNWIDFMAIWPFFVFYLTGIQAFQMLLVVRVLRLFRFVKLSYGLQIIIQTLKASVQELFLLLLILLIPVVLFSSIVYYVENLLQKDNNKTQFESIPASIWWCLITMTTVGYGDITPVSPEGKIVGGMVAICGILIVALPISVIGSNFSLFYAHAQARLKLPVKQRRLVLGGVPGLISKHNELSSRRIVKKRATIFEHGDHLDMETNWLSSERVLGISDGMEPSETGTDNEKDDMKQASKTPILSPMIATNRKLCGDEVFSDGELNKLNRYKMQRPRRAGLLPVNKLKEDTKRGSNGSGKVSFTKLQNDCKFQSDESIATFSPRSSRTSLKRKNSDDNCSVSTNPYKEDAISDSLSVNDVEIPNIHLTDNKTWNLSSSSSESVATPKIEDWNPPTPSLCSSTNSIKNSNLNLRVNSPCLCRRTSSLGSELCRGHQNVDFLIKLDKPKDEEKQVERKKQTDAGPAREQSSMNGLTCPHHHGAVVLNGSCLQDLNGRTRAASQPCSISQCANANTAVRNTSSVLETNI